MTPLLLVDAGNSLIKWAVVTSDGKIEVKGEMITREADAGQIKALAEKFQGYTTILASVVPQATSWFAESFGTNLFPLTANSPGLPLTFDYPNPAQVGADRIAAAVAAAVEKLYPCIIVSCGTATAFTVLNRRGAFCGGAIAPGPQTQLNSLANAAAQLPTISLDGHYGLPAESTEEAIRAGVVLSFQGGVKEIIARLGGALHILLTGGHADLLHPVIHHAELRPLLVFEGLRIMGERYLATRSS